MTHVALSSLAMVMVSLPLLAAWFSAHRRGWQFAQWLSLLGLALVVVAWVLRVQYQVSWGQPFFHLTPLTLTILGLIGFIEWVVLHYGRDNFADDPDGERFLQGLLLTVFFVKWTVISNHLMLFWLGWVGISLSLHKLLMFYPDRPRAALAAHKKFLFARLAEILLAIAFILLYLHHDTVRIDAILNAYPVTDLSRAEHWAAILLAMVALVKCAQLPLHGWLIQVVESPTPVSALLHAGVINLGGFLLLLFAPLFSLSLPAQWLVILIAGVSAVIAALVMMTRISIKVRLAWSTTSQMGLMLVECALGLYELALMHLLAHSCYKAYAFLTAGSTVRHNLYRRFSPPILPSLKHWLLALPMTIVLLALFFVALNAQPPVSPWLVLAIAIQMTIAHILTADTKRSYWDAWRLSVMLLVGYALFKQSMHMLVPQVDHGYVWQTDIWFSGLLIVLLVLHLYLQYFPQQSVSRKLFVALNAGFYLDEWSTRLTLWIWPIQLPKSERRALKVCQEVTQ